MTGEGAYLLSPSVTSLALASRERKPGASVSEGPSVPVCEEGGVLCVLGRENGGEWSCGCGLLFSRKGFRETLPFCACWLRCDSEPVHVLPDQWGSLCPLSGDSPVITMFFPWWVSGREWGATQGHMTEQVLLGS